MRTSTFQKKVKDFFSERKFNAEGCPDVNIFRYLGNFGFNYKDSNVLDIGFGNFENLNFLKKKKCKIYGVEINKALVEKYKKKYNINSKNLKRIDLNEKFPNFGNVKFDLIISIDVIYYLANNRIIELLKFINTILNTNGIFIFQFVQANFNYNYKGYFNFNLDKNYKKTNFLDKDNPIRYLQEQFLLKTINLSGLKLENSFFSTSNHFLKKKKRVLRINRYLILKKK